MKKRQQYETFIPPDGTHWFKNYILLRGGGYHHEWRIARIVGGTVEILGPVLTLDPDNRYLHLAMWGPAIPHPDTVEDYPTARTSAGGRNRQNRKKRLGIASFPEEPTGHDSKTLVVAESIVNAVVEAFLPLRDFYRDHPAERNAFLRLVAEAILAVRE